MNRSIYRGVSLAALAVLVLHAAPGRAESSAVNPGKESGAGFAEDARYSIQFVAGGLFFPVGLGPDDRVFHTVPTNLRFGWWMTPVLSDGWSRGRFEAILELSAATVVEGAGSIVVGPTGILRYDFVQRDARWVPYFQIGAGVVYTDAHHDRDQQTIGQALEFSLQGSLGARYALSAHWSLDAELQYQHISNANLAPRNVGINSLGGLVGFSWHWRPRTGKQRP